MNKNEKNANSLRNVESGKNGKSLVKLLTKQTIDYDKVDNLLLRDPSLIGLISCTLNGNQLMYEAPNGLHRDIQALNLRAICVVCYALKKAELELVCDNLSRRKQHFIKSAWTRFHQAAS